MESILHFPIHYIVCIISTYNIFQVRSISMSDPPIRMNPLQLLDLMRKSILGEKVQKATFGVKKQIN